MAGVHKTHKPGKRPYAHQYMSMSRCTKFEKQNTIKLAKQKFSIKPAEGLLRLLSNKVRQKRQPNILTFIKSQYFTPVSISFFACMNISEKKYLLDLLKLSERTTGLYTVKQQISR